MNYAEELREWQDREAETTRRFQRRMTVLQVAGNVFAAVLATVLAFGLAYLFRGR